jgi:alkylation response protein AidB-like acyl-CoA dehydrogenase
MNDRELLVDSVAALFARHAPLQGRRKSTDIEQRDRLWAEVERADLTAIGVAESHGGAGGSLADTCAVVRAAARFAAPVPIAETQLAAWLASEAGLRWPSGQLTVGPTLFGPIAGLTVSPARKVSGRIPRVPFATTAHWLVLLIPRAPRFEVAVIDLARATVSDHGGLSGDTRATVHLNDVEVDDIGATTVSHETFLARGALIRAHQIAGALARTVELAVQYSAEREQFGRPIGKFQAVQHLLAQLAAESAAATMVAEAAAEMAETGSLVEAAAIAKSRTGLAARATALAHQVHGAIGVTEEHPLHLLTTRIWEWRDDFGADVEWSVRLGQHVALRGGANVWAAVAAIS